MSNPVERVDITTGDRAEHLARGLKSIRDGYVIVVPPSMGMYMHVMLLATLLFAQCMSFGEMASELLRR